MAKKVKRKAKKRRKPRKFSTEKKAEILAAAAAAPRGSKGAVYEKYRISQEQASRWRSESAGKKVSKKKSAKSRVLREFKEVKATLLARKKELEAELKEINAALKG